MIGNANYVIMCSYVKLLCCFQILYTTDYGLEKCYLFVDAVKFGWNLAQNNCTARGGNLVAVHSSEENSFILSWAARTTVNVMWIGLKVNLFFIKNTIIEQGC